MQSKPNATALRRLCLVIAVAVLLGLAGCSGDTSSSDDEPDGGADDAGGDTGGGDCDPNIVVGDTCEILDAVCGNGITCCQCIDFEEAPTCGYQWDCATLQNNDVQCPDTPPEVESACTPVDLRCQYCPANVPVFFECSPEEVGSDNGVWIEVEGLVCFEK